MRVARFSLLLICLALCGCQRVAHQVATIPTDDQVVVAKSGEPVGLDPANVTDLESIQVTRAIYDTLVEYAPDSTEIVAGLAESWEFTDSGRTLTFKLRPNVTFHDGTPLTASAVKDNYQRQQDPEHPLRSPGDTFFYWSDSWGDQLTSIDVLDPLTIRFRFREPVAPALDNFAMPFFGIASPMALEKYGRDYFRHPVGTGSFRFEHWVPGERLELSAFADSWRGAPEIDRLTFLPVPDSAARELRLRKGEVHIATAISPQAVERLKADDSVELLESPGLNVAFLAINNRHPALSEQRVRQAIWSAVDREALVRGLYYGAAETTDTALPPGSWARKVFPTPAFDPEAGRALMEELGYSEQNRLRLRLWYMAIPRSYLPEPKATGEAIARMLEEIHIECDIEPIDWGIYLDRVGRGEHDLALAGWIGDHGDPDNFLSFIFGSANIDDVVGGTNVLFYSNDEVDRALDEGRREPDQEQRKLAYYRVQEQVANDLPWLPLAHAHQLVGSHPALEGLLLHPSGLLRLEHIRWQRNP